MPLLFVNVANAELSPDGIWQQTTLLQQSRAVNAMNVPEGHSKSFRVDTAKLEGALLGAPCESLKNEQSDSIIYLPDSKGGFTSFKIYETQVMAPELAAKFPEIKTYCGSSLDDPSTTVRISKTPHGFYAQILSPNESFYIDPAELGDQKNVICYRKCDISKDKIGFSCQIEDSIKIERSPTIEEDPLTEENSLTAESSSTFESPALFSSAFASSGAELRTYRLAVAATGEYTAFHGGTVADGMAAIVTAINRINNIYEVELSIRLELIANNDLLIYTDPGSDPYTNNNLGSLRTENQANIDTVIGSVNYDVGHVFATVNGGSAAVGVAGVDSINAPGIPFPIPVNIKAQGVSGRATPTGESFYLLVAHEIGHQFGANHTFNGDSNSCSGSDYNADTAYEPGSGSTIMSYSGLCSNDNLQNNRDPYFHSISFDQIIDHVDNVIPSVGTRTVTGNAIPTVDAGADYTIPANTPFTLTATGSDADVGDILTYTWEQRDLGPQQDVNAGDNGLSPLFRSWTATSEFYRIFPRLSDLVDNTTVIGETLPTTNRTMNFRVTVRDNVSNGGGVNSDDMAVTVVDTGAPFAVTNPNSAVVWPGSTLQTVTWDVAGTTGNGINAANVSILLSPDGGLTYPQTLLESTLNDGSAEIVVPDSPTTMQARIGVQADNNIFFDISDTDFTISPSLVQAFIPSNGTTDLPIDADLGIEFSVLVQKGTSGNITVYLASNNSVVETIPVISSDVTVNSTVATIDRTVDLALGETYYVQIDAGSFEDLSGNVYAGITDTTTWSFTTTVNSVNNDPVAVDDNTSTSEDTAVTISVLVNDTDADGDTLLISLVTQGANGTVINNGTDVTYTPAANFNGTDSFTYTISDGNGGSDVATVNVTITAVNDAPVAEDDAGYAVDEDASILGAASVLLNDTDNESNTLNAVLDTDVSNGTLTLYIDGTFDYTPNADFNGADSFTYFANDGTFNSDSTATVTITINPVNDAPVAVSDSVNVAEGATLASIAVLLNDTDVEGDSLSLTAITQGANGSVSNNGDGTLSYTHDGSETLSDSFTYTIEDGNGGTATGTVNVTITEENDAPVAADDSAATDEDTAVTVAVLTNDSDVDGDTLLVSSVTQGANGAVTNNGTDVTYTPAANFNGADSFTYTIEDGNGGSATATVNVTINLVNDEPTAANDSETTDEDTPVVISVLNNDSDIDGDTLTINTTTDGANGTVADNGDGTVTYAPDANFNGSDSFTYTIIDGNGGTATGTVDVAVSAVNDAPVAANDSASTTEDTAVIVDVLGNDTDVDEDALSVTLVTDGANGTVTNNFNGTVTYTPAVDFNGSDSFTYTVSDGNGGEATASVTIGVGLVNDAPVAVSDSASTAEDTAVTVAVLTNDSDVDGDALSISSVTQGANGAVANNGTDVTYTPAANFNGLDSFTYTIEDGNGGSATATVNVTINPVNDEPTAANDSETTDEDTPVVISVLSNDSDVDGDTLTINTTTDGANGTVADNGDGTVTYTPDANFNGSDSFTYTIIDGNGGTATGTVDLAVSAVNDAPVAANDSASTTEDTAVIVDVLGNDSDVDEDALSVTLVTDGANGTVTNNFNGTVTYTPAVDFNGSDSFTYTVSDGNGGEATGTVTIGVGLINDAPVAVSDSASTAEDTAVTVAVLTNDSDIDGDTLSVSSVTQGANGAVANDGTNVTYTPDANFNGLDSFTYTIEDGNGGSATATVNVTINPVNDEPTAANDSETTDEDTPVVISVLSNDSDVDGDTLTINTTTDGANGTVADNGDGTVTYTPDANFNGSDSFTYTIIDGNGGTATGTVDLAVSAVNDAPVAANDSASTTEDTAVIVDVLGNDSDVDEDALSVTLVTDGANGTVTNNFNGTVTYTPAVDFNGSDSFTYTVSDGNGGEATGTVTIGVGLINDAPVAVSDSASTAEDTAVTVAVLTNDSDIDGDTLSVSSVTQGANGAVANDGTNVTYTPDANFNGLDSFTYTIEDGNGGSATATVNVTINPVNDEPTAANDSETTDEDTPVVISVLNNDSDVDGDTLTINTTTDGANGTVADNGDGTVTYTPDANFNGSDSFTYTIIDGNGGTATGTVDVAVSAVNDAPVAANDSASTTEDTAVTVDVLGNDSDVDEDALSVTLVTDGANGTVTNNFNGTVTYTPAVDFNGSDSFTYTVSDGNGGEATGTVTIGVGLINDAPVAVSDSASTAEDTAVTVAVLTNDSDIDGDTLSVSSVTQGANGAVANDGTNVTYTPDANFNGLDSFTYTIEDGNGGSATATVNVTINPVNDEPTAANDSETTDEDTPVVISVLNNDSDVDGDTLTINTTTDGANGTVADNGDGTVTYTPDANFNGSDSFTYTIIDGNGGTATGTVDLAVSAVNDAPVAANDSASTTEDTAVTVDVLGNDSDVDEDALSVTLITDGANGTVTNNFNGTVTYTPAVDFNGSDNFNYTVSDGNGGEATGTVTIGVGLVNDAPVAVSDSASTAEDTAVTVAVLTNDSDVDGDTLSVSSVTQGSNGAVANNGTDVTYTPDANFNGLDSFTYTIEDGNGGSATATVNVTINPVNDEPTAANDSETTDEDTPVVISVLSNDSDVDDDTLTINTTTDGADGTVTDNGDGTVTYTPDANFNGSDSFTYTIIDGNGGTATGTVDLAVSAVNDAPVAANDSASTTEDTAVTVDVLGNDSDVDEDALSVTLITDGANGTVTNNFNGTVTYTPAVDFNGSDNFNYTVSDGNGGEATGTVTIGVGLVNDAPVAVSDSASTAEDTAVTVAVLTNDSDVDGDTLSVSSVTQGSNGAVANNGTDVTYTPDANFNGLDSFTYTIEDGNGGSATATVNVTINPVNDEPTAANDSETTDEDTPVVISVLSNDSDVDDDTLTINTTTDGADGTVTDNGDGTVTYAPDANFNGSDSFTYTIIDGNGGTATGTVDVAVSAVNDTPVAANDSASTTEDTAVIVDVLGNDSDVDEDALSVTLVNDGANGTVTNNFNGTVTYTPAVDFNGSDSFTYTVSDGNSGEATGTVTIGVGLVNDAPVAVSDSASTPEDTAVTVAVLTNDSDVDGDTLSVSSVTQSANGAVANNGTDVTYTPAANFNGLDSFTYTIEDGNGGSATATVDITVTAVNDEPTAANDGETTDEDTPVVISVLSNDSDVDGDTLTINTTTDGANGTVADNGDGTVTYAPDANFNGSDSFTYTIIDGNGGTATGTVDVAVSAVNDAPVAANDSASTTEDTAVTVDVLGNDSDIDEDALSVTLVTDGANGTVTNNFNGTVTYTPAVDFNGSDSFTYTVSDGNGGEATGTVTIGVGLVNDAPVAVSDSASTPEDTAVTVAVLTNDSDVDGDTLSVSSVTQGSNGAVANNGTDVTYTPAANFNGTDSFTYTIEDGNGGNATATVNVTIDPVNDEPTAANDSETTDEDTPVVISVLSNDSDVDGDTLTINTTTDGANGTVTDNGDGTVTYAPDANFNGSDSFTYTIIDGNGGTATGTVDVAVSAVNDTPVAANDSASTTEDTAVIVDVLGNDSDVDEDALSVTLVNDGANGTVTNNFNGTVTYTPAVDFNGSDSFTYTVSDGNSGEATGTVTIGVGLVNDAPVAVSDSASTPEDTAVTVAVLTNDSDVDGDTLSVSSVTQSANGAVANNGTDVTYTPAANFNGLDSFTYTIEDGNGGSATATVDITVTAVNDEPTAANDGETTDEDTPVVISVLSNDSDVDGDTLTINTTTDGANGTVADNGDGTVTYAPDANFNGSDSFTYTIIDGNGGTATGTVDVAVSAVNDAPVAANDSASTTEDTAVTVDVLGNDSDIDEDALSVTLVTDGANGTVTNNFNGTVTYTPAVDFNGSDSFTYTVSDGNGGEATGTVTIGVGLVNDAPVAVSDSASTPEDTAVTVAVLTNDSDVDGDTLSVSSVTQGSNGAVANNGTDVTYTPAANFNGTDSFTYTIEDGNGGNATATVNVTIDPVNDEPTAANDSETTDEDTPVVISVLSNDSDVDGDTLTINTTTDGANGTVTDNGDGTVTYAPDANFNGSDSFTYTIIDGNGGTATGTVDVAVSAVNDTPVAANDSASTTEDTAVTVDVLGNDSDIDEDALSVTLVTDSANGTVTNNFNGTVTYTPAVDFNGSDSFTYTIEDGNGGEATGTVTIGVGLANDAPVAADDSASTAEDTAVTVAVLTNDSDVDGDTLSVSSVTQGSNGAVANNGTDVTYTPAANFNGTDSFTYTIEDGNGGNATATVNVTIDPVNDEPTAANDSETTDEDTPVVISVLSNDSDVDGDTLTINTTTDGANGTVADNGDGTVTYAPDANFNGSDSFTYTIIDGNGGTATGTVDVAVSAVNDAPVAANDSASTTEDTAVIVDVLGNDSDVDEDALSVTLVNDGANGTVTNNFNGTVTYTPAVDFNGSDSFTYTVSDGNGGEATGTVTIGVGLINDAPVAVSDSASTPEDTAVTVAVLTNDSDIDGDTLSVSSVTQGANGAVANDGTNVTYTPDANFNGMDSFTYTIEDGNGGSATAQVDVTVTAVNDAPVAAADNASTDEETAVTIDVLANDGDIDGDSLTIDSASVTSGTVATVTGQLQYTPAANFNGLATISYTISDGNGGSDSAQVDVIVNAVNDAPVASADSATTSEDTSVTVDVLNNDIDVDDIALTVIATTDPASGTVVNNGTDVTYTPAANFNGSDSFTYTISDGNGGVDTATVTITVTAENDAPTFEAGTDESLPAASMGAFSRTLSFVDPDANIWTGTVDFGDGSGEQALAIDSVNNSFVLNYTYASAGSYPVIVTLNDNEGGTATDTFTVSVALSEVGFAQASFETNEDSGTSTAVVLQRNDASVAFQVNVQIIGGTAQGGGVDYDDSTFPQLITFEQGELTKTVPITVIDDDLGEPSETVELEVIAVDNVAIAAQNTTALTILNTDFDYGDAPSPYPTLLAEDGARHLPLGPALGTIRDLEDDGQPDVLSEGDDINGSDDEDGIRFTSPLIASTTSNTTSAVTVELSESTTAVLDAWIDYNQDGDWLDANEKIFAGVALAEGENQLTFAVPAGSTVGTTFARFRVSSNGSDLPTGLVDDGEVEDYSVQIVSIADPITVLIPENSGNTEISDVNGVLQVVNDGEVLFEGSLTEITDLTILGTNNSGDVTISANGTLNGSLSIEGDLNAVNFNGALSVAGAISVVVTGDIQVTGMLNGTGNSLLQAGGNIQLNNGEITVSNGNLTLDSTGNLGLISSVIHVPNGDLSATAIRNMTLDTNSELTVSQGDLTANAGGGLFVRDNSKTIVTAGSAFFNVTEEILLDGLSSFTVDNNTSAGFGTMRLSSRNTITVSDNSSIHTSKNYTILIAQNNINLVDNSRINATDNEYVSIQTSQGDLFIVDNNGDNSGIFLNNSNLFLYVKGSLHVVRSQLHLENGVAQFIVFGDAIVDDNSLLTVNNGDLYGQINRNMTVSNSSHIVVNEGNFGLNIIGNMLVEGNSLLKANNIAISEENYGASVDNVESLVNKLQLIVSGTTSFESNSVLDVENTELAIFSFGNINMSSSTLTALTSEASLIDIDSSIRTNGSLYLDRNLAQQTTLSMSGSNLFINAAQSMNTTNSVITVTNGNFYLNTRQDMMLDVGSKLEIINGNLYANVFGEAILGGTVSIDNEFSAFVKGNFTLAKTILEDGSEIGSLDALTIILSSNGNIAIDGRMDTKVTDGRVLMNAQGSIEMASMDPITAGELFAASVMGIFLRTDIDSLTAYVNGTGSGSDLPGIEIHEVDNVTLNEVVNVNGPILIVADGEVLLEKI